MKSFLSLTILTLLFLCSCLKVKEFPIVPEIKVVSTTLNDSNQVAVVLTFTDGDGDIGLAASDTFPPYDPQNIYYNNLLVKYYKETGGNWSLAAEFGYRIKPITPMGKVKVLEGEMTISPLFTDSDTIKHKVKYTFQLVDRALHVSNEVESAEFELGD